MSNLAFSTLPTQSPGVPAEYAPGRTRHIEIVTSRTQKRARPRLVYALVTVAGLFVILMAQLLLSIVLSDGAYQITGLQSAQTDLTRDQQTLTEQLDILKSPQSLSSKAEALGMIMNNGSPVYLNLADNSIIGTPKAATAVQGAVVGAGGSLIANSLLGTPPPTGTGEATAPPGTDPVTGAPASTTTGGSVASDPGALPSPNTH